jgi:hypothetical protein
MYNIYGVGLFLRDHKYHCTFMLLADGHTVRCKNLYWQVPIGQRENKKNNLRFCNPKLFPNKFHKACFFCTNRQKLFLSILKGKSLGKICTVYCTVYIKITKDLAQFQFLETNFCFYSFSFKLLLLSLT